MSDPPVVYVIDDDDAVRDSLVFLLESAGFAARAYDNAVAFLETDDLARVRGCIITDVRMPDMDGLELQEELGRRDVRLPVIIMTGHGDVPVAVRAMKAGAIDFLEKPFEDELILAAVERALQSHAPGSTTRLDAATANCLSTLTEREREVLEGIVVGRSNKAVARDLGISPRTVEVYRARVMEKMQAYSLADLVRMTLSAGVVDAGKQGRRDKVS